MSENELEKTDCSHIENVHGQRRSRVEFGLVCLFDLYIPVNILFSYVGTGLLELNQVEY